MKIQQFSAQSRAFPGFHGEISNALASCVIDIWWLRLETVRDVVEKSHRVLDVVEKARAARFHFEHDAQKYVTTRAALRCLLSFYTGIAPREIALEYSPHGKPSLHASQININAIHFNVSHARDCAVFAFGREPVGIDIEYSICPLPLREMASYCLTKSELEVWLTLPTDHQTRYFLEIWTAKEAILKAEGDGLAKPMNSFQVSFAETEIAAMNVGYADWSVFSWRDFAVENYVAALASSSFIDEVRWNELSAARFQQLLAAAS